MAPNPGTRIVPPRAEAAPAPAAKPRTGKAAPPPAPPAAAPAAPRRKAETVQSTAATRPRPSAPRPAPRRAHARGGRPGRAPGPHFSLAIPQALQREIVAVLVCLFAVLTAIGLGSSRPSGVLSAWGGGLHHLFGWTAWMIPVAIAAAGAMLFVAGLLKIDRLRWEMPLGLALILIGVIGLVHMPIDDKAAAGQAGDAGGLVGWYVSSLLETLAGRLGGTAVLLALAIIGAMMAFHLSLGDLLRLAGRGGAGLLALVGGSTPAAAAPPGGILPPGRRGALAAEVDGLPPDVPRINPGDRSLAPTTPLPGVPFAEPATPRIL